MNRFASISTFTAFFVSSSAFAALSPADLPYIEGTPLAQISGDGSYSWTILDYHSGSAEGAFTWVWLQNAMGDNAYLLYPANGVDTAVTFPNNELVEGRDGRIVAAFRGDSLNLTFDAFGGKVVVAGEYVLAEMPAADAPHAAYPLHFSLASMQSVQIEASAPTENDANADAVKSMQISTDGRIISITGGDLRDSLAGLKTPNTWTIDGAQNGTYRTDTAQQSITFDGFESLYGGDEIDVFEVNATLEMSIEAAVVVLEAQDGLSGIGTDCATSGGHDASVTSSHEEAISWGESPCPLGGNPQLLDDSDSSVLIDSTARIHIHPPTSTVSTAEINLGQSELQPPGQSKKRGGSSHWVLLAALSLTRFLRRKRAGGG